jgi:ABC-type uncharacterized transport system substrate-binding protein
VALPRLNYDQLRSRYANSSQSSETGRFTALLLDQPLSRRFDLIRLILPQARRVSIALGKETRNYTSEVEQQARLHQLQLQQELVLDEDDLLDILNDILVDSDALLGLLDPVVFNRANSRNILLTAYRWRVPIFGISPAYVRAGALAAVYTQPEQIGWQIAETLVESRKNGGMSSLPEYLYPKYFEVTVNYQVAESMGLQIEREAKLKRELMASED